MFKDGQRNRLEAQDTGRLPWEPTPEEIAAQCAVIRMGWSEHEERARWQLGEWRQQAPHCPADLRRMLNDAG